MLASHLYPNEWQSAKAMLGRHSQALLITGKEGLGKAGLALALSEWLLCEANPIDAKTLPHEPCGECDSCRLVAIREHPDLKWILPGHVWGRLMPWWGPYSPPAMQSSNQIKIEEIRGLSDFMNLSSFRGGRRVVVIWPADSMNKNTANALLKSLEEPERGLSFILVSDHPHRLPATIRSRCRELAVRTPPANLARDFLQSTLAKTDDRTTKIDNATLEDILSLSGGAPLRAFRLLPHSALILKLRHAITENSGAAMMAIAESTSAAVKKKATSKAKAKSAKASPKGKSKTAQDNAEEDEGLITNESADSLGLEDILDILQRLLTDAIAQQFHLPPPYTHPANPTPMPIWNKIGVMRTYALLDEIVYFRRHLVFTLNTRQVLERLLLQLAQINPKRS